jgi:hypothetical protein
MEQETVKAICNITIGAICGSLLTLAIEELVAVFNPPIRRRRATDTIAYTPQPGTTVTHYKTPTLHEQVNEFLDKLEAKQ